MTIPVTATLIASATRGSIFCPIYQALRAAGFEVACVDYPAEPGSYSGHKPGKLAIFLHAPKGDMVIQELPSAVTSAIETYDKTGRMDPFVFELPDPV